MRSDIEKIINEELMILTRPGWTYHPPVLDENGKFKLGFPEHEAFIEINKRFFDAGVRVNLSNLPAGWIDEDTYDFNSMDETLDKLFTAIPDALYIPRLRLDPPFKWLEKHPEEVCVFQDGPRDFAKIAQLVREGRVNNTYNMTLPPNPNGLQPLRLEEPIGLQSFSSKLWVKDACKALEAVITHILEGPYADRFIGFHICFGGTCELLHWGNGGSKIGDFSIKNTLNFFDWALEKYKSLEKLRKAWDLPNLTRENAFVPPESYRETQSDGPDAIFMQTGRATMGRDYELFHSETVIDAFLELAKTSKKLAPDLAVGAFYGYEHYGHEHIDKMLESPYVDYLSAPKPYDNPQPGGRGGSVPKVASVLRKKQFVEEIDNRPHTAWDPRKFAPGINVAPAANLAETANVLWREVCKLEQMGASWWWMDQGDAKHRWYDSDEIMQIVKEQVKVHSALQKSPAEDICQVLCISDTAANYYGGIDFPSRSKLLCSATPFKEYRMSDIDYLDLSPYKLLIFSQPQLLTKAQLDNIQSRISSDCQIMFTDLPGVCANNFSLDNVYELCQMRVCYCAEKQPPHRIFTIDNGADEVILSDSFGARVARKGNIWLVLDRDISTSDFIDILKRQGIKRIIPAEGVVHGNNELLGVFALENHDINGNVSLPQKTDWFEWFTKETYPCTDQISVSLKPKEARLFISKKLFEKSGIFNI